MYYTFMLIRTDKRKSRAYFVPFCKEYIIEFRLNIIVPFSYISNLNRFYFELFLFQCEFTVGLHVEGNNTGLPNLNLLLLMGK